MKIVYMRTQKKYTSKFNKNTSTKKMSCQWHVNASCPKENNSDSAIFINTIVDEHNHDLNIKVVAFREDKKFSDEIVDDIQFLTQHCKLEAITQRKYLEVKYPFHQIFSQ